MYPFLRRIYREQQFCNFEHLHLYIIYTFSWISACHLPKQIPISRTTRIQMEDQEYLPGRVQNCVSDVRVESSSSFRICSWASRWQLRKDHYALTVHMCTGRATQLRAQVNSTRSNRAFSVNPAFSTVFRLPHTWTHGNPLSPFRGLFRAGV